MIGAQNTTIACELKKGHPVATYTTGRSMEPLLKEGKTYVVIKPLKEKLQVGDLPIYQRPDGIYIIHRLIGKEGDYYLTRGDNCLNCEKVSKKCFLGIVTEIQKNGRIIHVTDKKYQRYVWIWQKIWPVRRQIYRLRILKNKCKNAVRRILG